VFHGKGWRGHCEAAFSRLCPCRQGSDAESVDQSGTSRDEGVWTLVRSAKMRRWPQSLHCQRRLVRPKDRLCTGQNECLWLQPHLRSSGPLHRRLSGEILVSKMEIGREVAAVVLARWRLVDARLHAIGLAAPDENESLERRIALRKAATRFSSIAAFLGCVGVSQPDPTGKPPVTTVKPPATALSGARVRVPLLYRTTRSLGGRPGPLVLREDTYRKARLIHRLTERYGCGVRTHCLSVKRTKT
jgi:hypothetical protein